MDLMKKVEKIVLEDDKAVHNFDRLTIKGLTDKVRDNIPVNQMDIMNILLDYRDAGIYVAYKGEIHDIAVNVVDATVELGHRTDAKVTVIDIDDFVDKVNNYEAVLFTQDYDLVGWLAVQSYKRVHEEKGHNIRFEEMELCDGTSLSVQASELHMCNPRETLDTGSYLSVEVYTHGKLVDGLHWREVSPSTFGYVPLELLQEVITKHGGIECII